MAKKRKNRKQKRTAASRRTAAPVQTAASSVESVPAVSAAAAAAASATVQPRTRPAASAESVARWSYVRADVRQIAILFGVCVGLELLLWYLFEHSGLGSSIYSLVKL